MSEIPQQKQKWALLVVQKEGGKMKGKSPKM